MSEDRSKMTFGQLAEWAWRETPPVHRNTRNLMIHLFAVPLFVIGHLLIIAAIVGRPWLLIAAVLCIVVSLALQKHGHSLEQTPSHPFQGPRDFIRRIYAEQFCNYWRFLFSGQLYASFKTQQK